MRPRPSVRTPPTTKRVRIRPLILLTVALFAACTTSRQGDRRERDPYVISERELNATVRMNLYDAILELRPRWLTRTSRGESGEPYVYVDDQIIGTAAALRRFQPHQVAEARYLSATEAQTRYGQRNFGHPAIIIRVAR